MRITKGWKKIDNERGFINETTGQNLMVTKKKFGEHFVVLLFTKEKDKEEGQKLSPEYPTEAKAEAFALDWMAKHTQGTN
jgi:hypothetical protein